MKRFLLMSVYLIAFGWLGQSFAQVKIVGTPSFVNPQEPEFRVCQRVNLYYDCTADDVELGDFIPVTFRLKDGSDQQARVPAVIKVVCEGGLCMDEGDNYYGEIKSPHPTPMHIPQGHYVYQPNTEVKPSVWRWGHGPIGGQFPALQVVGPEQDRTLGSLWCSLQVDSCAYEGEEYSRAELPGAIPFADVQVEEGRSHFCQFESCFDTDGNFIGLNPFFVQYQTNHR